MTSGLAPNPTAPDTTPDARPSARLPFDRFVWAAGIECSTLPHLGIDQFAWTQHDRQWRDDFSLIRDGLGVSHLRYAIPWHLCEPQRGVYDWSVADERIDHAESIGLDLMLDVMHFGTPLWLKQAVGDPEFPEALEAFAHAIVSRYAGRIKTWCAFNEPQVSALFSGDLGFWPPHGRKWRGYMPVLSRIVQATGRAMRAIRAADPQATVLVCDAAENYKTRDDSLAAEVRLRNLRRFVVMDLLTGRVDANHPLHGWLTGYGLSELDLEYFRTHPQTPDVLGLDYYPHCDWQLERHSGGVRQKRADSPAGLYAVADAHWQRYGVPLMVTETSIEGKPINREIWLDQTIDDCARLRADGVPMLGVVWWPVIDHLDWDGAMTHRVGKLHEVGLFHLRRQPDGTLKRVKTPLADQYRDAAAQGDERVGPVAEIARPTATAEDEGPPLLGTLDVNPRRGKRSAAPGPVEDRAAPGPGAALRLPRRGADGSDGHANGSNGSNGSGADGQDGQPAPGLGAAPEMHDGGAMLSGAIGTDGASVDGLGVEPQAVPSPANLVAERNARSGRRDTGRHGIVVFSHLRWGFVWQRPQQFLSRFAKKHPILFVEEPFFDVKEGGAARLEIHAVMPNVTVACPHCPASWATDPSLPDKLRAWANEAIEAVNDSGDFDAPLLWYYSPMDSAWSLGHFPNRGVVYDCMDELSQFTGAPKALVQNERRLMDHADVVFTGGYNLWTKKREQHGNVHFFGCGVEYSHFAQAQDADTVVPPDVDFMPRPILGWFGVVDERVDYAMVGEMARMRPDWSFAMVGPVVKVDPNLLPHSPNLFWLGGRDYGVLPNYCRAFDVNMMCFALNAATEYINPTKALEYLATGKPVVSTPVKDVVRQYSDLVEIADTPEAFVAAAERALQSPDRDRIAAGVEKARASSWESTVATMQGLIRDAIAADDRPSARDVEPIDAADLEYLYAPTQGS